MKKQDTTWFWMAPLGLMLIGLGFSLAGEATLRKGANRPLPEWVGMGTLGLLLFNAGISVFGDAVKRRAVQEILDAQSG